MSFNVDNPSYISDKPFLNETGPLSPVDFGPQKI